MALDLESREGKIIVAIATDIFRKNGIVLKDVVRGLKSDLASFNKKHNFDITIEEYAEVIMLAAKAAFDHGAAEIKAAVEADKNKK